MKANSLHITWKPHYSDKNRETFRGIKSLDRAKEILSKRSVSNIATARFVDNDRSYTELVNADGPVKLL